MEKRWWELPPGEERRASPIWNGTGFGVITNGKLWPLLSQRGQPGLEEAGAAQHEKEDGHQARKPQQKFPQTREKQ